MQHEHRHLAAILFTDVVGYTSMMQKDEEEAVACIKRHNTIMEKTVAAHHGEVANFYGDGCLCIFSSATEAIRCAVEVQQQFQHDPVIPLRVGLHIGEIFFEDGKVMGDGVNIASRIQSLGQANTILFSKEIFDKIRNQPGFKSFSLGMFEFKNVDEPMEIFALANEGLQVPKRETIEGKLKTEKKISLRKKLTIGSVIMLFLIFISVFVYNQFPNHTVITGKEKSIAILPFKIIGNNDDKLGEGIVEDIYVHLSKIKELTVISYKSRASDSLKSLKEIGEELKAIFLVQGSVREDNNRIRLNATLIESRTGNTIWADDYTRAKTGIFDLQTELATQIVTALKTKLTPEEKIGLSKRYTENVEAYKLYIKGRSFWNAQGRENFDSAEANYKRAIQLEPDYALAYAGLADCYAINFKALSQLEEVPIAKIYAAKALSLDSTLSEALTTMGFIQQNFDYEWMKAKKNLEKAVDLDPNNSAAHSYYGLVLMNSTPDKETALVEMKKAVDLDPLSFRANWILARSYYFAGKYDLAIDQFKKLASFVNKAQQYVPIYSLGLIYLKKHLYSQAKDYFDQLPEGNDSQLDNYQVMQSYAYAVMGDKAKAITLLKKTLKKYPKLSHYRNSQVYVALGNFDRAMNELELGYETRGPHMFWVRVDPAFDPIRNESRFKALMIKMGFRET